MLQNLKKYHILRKIVPPLKYKFWNHCVYLNCFYLSLINKVLQEPYRDIEIHGGKIIHENNETVASTAHNYVTLTLTNWKKNVEKTWRIGYK